MLHGRELVKDFLFADTETAMSLGLTFDVLKLDGDVEAALMEVRSRFVVVVPLVHDSHLLVRSETVTCRLVAPVNLTLLQSLAD